MCGTSIESQIINKVHRKLCSGVCSRTDRVSLDLRLGSVDEERLVGVLDDNVVVLLVVVNVGYSTTLQLNLVGGFGSKVYVIHSVSLVVVPGKERYS